MNKKNKPGLLGKKIGMTRLFSPDGESIGVTVIKVGPCTVVQVKTGSHSALQVGFEEIGFYKVNRAMRGHFKKHGTRPFRFLREFAVTEIGSFREGQVLTVASFRVGELIQVTGVSKGKGFQGVIKRHKKGGGPASHGSCFHRSTGSIGQRTYPGKVFKLMKLPGHMGQDTVTVSNLKILHVDAERHLLFVRGAVPGSENALVMIRSAAPDFTKRLTESSQQDVATEPVESSLSH